MGNSAAAAFRAHLPLASAIAVTTVIIIVAVATEQHGPGSTMAMGRDRAARPVIGAYVQHTCDITYNI